MNVNLLSRRFGVNAEVKKDGEFPVFLSNCANKRILLITDANTNALAEPLRATFKNRKIAFGELSYPEREPVADEKTVLSAIRAAENYDYLLAVGAGTLNDIAKYAGFRLKKPSGIYATAPSMDGFTSGVTPLIENGQKITRPAQTASDVLIDYEVLKNAPRMMIGAGVGDILAKHCCLTDWKISSYLTGEAYNEEAADLMKSALISCENALPALFRGEDKGVEQLMNALLVSGYSMVIAGNSRPASGAEHHMSHYLELDFLRRGERIPLHGVKVGLGTLVSLHLYHTLKSRPAFSGCERVYEEAEKLPSVAEAEKTLQCLSCPVRFSELGVKKDTVRNMLFEAYKIRDRFTILTLYCTRGFMNGAADEIMDRFY